MAAVVALALPAGACGGAVAMDKSAESCFVNAPCTPPAMRFDPSFAEGMRTAFQGPANAAALLNHPALRGMMVREAADSPAAVLETARARAQRRMPTWRALDVWRSRGPELIAAADEAGAYLPRQVATFPGTIYLVAGHSSVPRPPDLLFDVTLPRFEQAPSSVPYHVTHEAHHIGFTRLRSLPVLNTTRDLGGVRSVVWALTQMEGMAVHAARARQLADPSGQNDFDYETYGSEEGAARATKRFAAWMACLNERTKPDELTPVLDALASGERLYFRFGALVSARIEAASGRDALVATILQPERFVGEAEGLLRTAGPVVCALGESQQILPHQD